MCVGSTILHEFGHVVYHSIVKEVRKTNRTPKALECVRTSSNRVCNLFNKVFMVVRLITETLFRRTLNIAIIEWIVCMRIQLIS